MAKESNTDNKVIGTVFLMILMIDVNNREEIDKLAKLAIREYPKSYYDYLEFTLKDPTGHFEKLRGSQRIVYGVLKRTLEKLHKNDQKKWKQKMKSDIQEVEYAAELHKLKYDLKKMFRYSDDSYGFKKLDEKKEWYNINAKEALIEDDSIYSFIDDRIEYMESIGKLKLDDGKDDIIEGNSYFKTGIEYCLFLDELGIIDFLKDKGFHEKERLAKILLRLFNLEKTYEESTVIRYLTALSQYRKEGKKPVSKISERSIERINEQLRVLGLH